MTKKKRITKADKIMSVLEDLFKHCCKGYSRQQGALDEAKENLELQKEEFIRAEARMCLMGEIRTLTEKQLKNKKTKKKKK